MTSFQLKKLFLLSLSPESVLLSCTVLLLRWGTVGLKMQGRGLKTQQTPFSQAYSVLDICQFALPALFPTRLLGTARD